MAKKLQVGVLFGGRSAEHEVSLESAKNVVEAMDRDRYEPVLIGVDKSGKWHLHENANFLLQAQNPRLLKLNQSGVEVALASGHQHLQPLHPQDQTIHSAVDVIFPVVHGTYGEDGTTQGLLRLAQIPFVGSGVLGSSVCMDKEFTKRLLQSADIPVGPYRCFKKEDRDQIHYKKLSDELGSILFVKPANMGSSVGISKVSSEPELAPAVEEAFLFDRKILIEAAIAGRELECAVLGNDHPKASTVGEIVPQNDFYSYEAKYMDENGALLNIPASLDPSIVTQIQELSIKAFTSLECSGLARVDFFLTPDNKIYLNEINTLPGFTRISMYPKLWEASGTPYPELIHQLIQLALERHQVEQSLKTEY